MALGYLSLSVFSKRTVTYIQVDHFKQHTIQKKIWVKAVLRDTSQTTQEHTSHPFNVISLYTASKKSHHTPRSPNIDLLLTGLQGLLALTLL